MERRDWSVKILKELVYIDSLDGYEKADNLVDWYNNYLFNNEIEKIDLELKDLQMLEELFFKNINFLKSLKEDTRKNLIEMKKIRNFLKN